LDTSRMGAVFAGTISRRTRSIVAPRPTQPRDGMRTEGSGVVACIAGVVACEELGFSMACVCVYGGVNAVSMA